MVFDNREDNTLQLYQSIMTTKNRNPFVDSSFIYKKVCHFFLCRFKLTEVILTAYSKHAFAPSRVSGQTLPVVNNSVCYKLSNLILNGRRVVSKKRLSEKELVKGMTPHTAHSDELAEVTLDELGLEISESDYMAALKRIKSLLDVADPGTPEGDELERLAALVEEYEEKHFPI